MPRGPSAPRLPTYNLAELKLLAVMAALRKHHFIQTRACVELGISRFQLLRYMQEMDIPSPYSVRKTVSTPDKAAPESPGHTTAVRESPRPRARRAVAHSEGEADGLADSTRDQRQTVIPFAGDAASA